MKDFVLGRDVRDRRLRQLVKDQIDHRFLVDRVRHRLQKFQIGEPVEFRIGDAVLDEVARVAIEAEKQRARVDAHLLNLNVEFVVFLLLLERVHFLGPRTVNIDLPRQVAQVLGVLILHDRHRPAVQARQLGTVLILHPIVVVAIVIGGLALRVTRHLVRAVADDLFRRRVDAPGVVKIPRLPHGLQDVRGNYLDAERIKQRRERLRQMHDDGVVVGRLGGDALVVDCYSGPDAVGHFGIVDNVEREQHVVGGKGLAVEPFHVVPQVKRNRLVVGGDLPFLGQSRLRQRRDGIYPQQAVEQIAGELAGGRIGDQDRIKGARIAGYRAVENLIFFVIGARPVHVASAKNRERRERNRAGQNPVAQAFNFHLKPRGHHQGPD